LKSDQIGQIFAYWAVLYIGSLFEKVKSSANYWDTFFQTTSCELILTKNWLGCTLGDFFKNSSGHPAAD
jgi:hypothetical protein